VYKSISSVYSVYAAAGPMYVYKSFIYIVYSVSAI
jgi:hypothetical protein